MKGSYSVESEVRIKANKLAEGSACKDREEMAEEEEIGEMSSLVVGGGYKLEECETVEVKGTESGPVGEEEDLEKEF